ncbi:hypothetical protein GR200_20685 [Rhizobium leguminosarum]|uniref:hypothetical protein n=1 Tax=Rhizobium leguminosarum TaxID=384 RepID=UPI0013BD3822|nr:hypothetical protein [Rhizobium leguminosarum]NEI57459.1 hypothetical protein [Rhizobium leguminosarum]NEI86319.1 hypothetical protein [Rhizobium leguminosarum]
MNSLNHHGNQASCSLRAANYRDQLSLLAVVHHLEDIAEDIASGRQVKALHAVQDLAGRALDDMRESLADHSSLAAFRPVHEINLALHGVRRALLEKRAKSEGWLYRWDDDAFLVEDGEIGLYLRVDRADNWSMSTDGTPDFLIADSGLAALLATLNGTALAEEVSRLSRWLSKKEAGQ